MTLAVLLTLLVACSPSNLGRPPGSSSFPAPEAQPSRTLVVAAAYEPESLAQRSPREGLVNVRVLKRVVNAELLQLDEHGAPRPYLAEAVPRLDTESWRVFPDGRMETTYRLRPNLTWHDGEPLTADDFVMSWRVFTAPGLGLAGSTPFRAMDEAVASDARTLVIRWKQIYPDPTFTIYREFPPLPAHLLTDAFQADQGDLFASDPYWTRGYVGLGPYKVDRWQPGSFIELSAFDGHAAGRPRIDRIRWVFISDAGTAMANMLAGETHFTDGSAVGGVQALLMKKEWAAGGGTVLFVPNQWRAAHFQLRSDLTTPAALRDPRVRKAMAYALDKPLLDRVLYEGEGFTTDMFIAASSPYGAIVDGAVVKYPHDLARSAQLMADAGFPRGADGTYVSASGARFVGDAKTNAGRDNELEVSAVAAMWRQAGFDFQESLLPAALAQDGEARATFPSVFVTSMTLGEGVLVNLTSANIPRPENRWRGNNRGSWINPEYDRLVAELDAALDQSRRGDLIAQAARIQSDDLQAISLFFRPLPYAYVTGLRGIRLVPPETNIAWNIQEWEFR